jgi:nucleoside-diphosphate-sugar epimerase
MKKIDRTGVVISSKATIRDAIEAIDKNGLLGVFVCDGDGKLDGIVMDKDIRRAMLSNVDPKASVKIIMKTNPCVVDAGLPYDRKKEKLIKSGKILAPIIDEKRCVVDYIFLPEVMDEIYKERTVNDFEESLVVLPPGRVLVIGGAGYIGSVLVKKLLRLGYKVRVLDLLLYGRESVAHFNGEKTFEFIRGDCRDEGVVRQSLEGVEAVIQLGEIVGDPACRISEELTIETNYVATNMVVEQCIHFNIRRFIFTSSCSAYGTNDKEVTEGSELNPVSLYARCKIESEKAILSHNYDHFCPTILRLATVHGISYRQRFDLVVNLLTIQALVEGRIRIFGGEQWRPFVSVKDICEAIVTVLHSPRSVVKGQIFNLGDSRENYQLFQIGNIVKEVIGDVHVEITDDNTDKRNYRVNFDKIKNKLGFSTEYKISDSVGEIVSAYRDENLFCDYKTPKYHNHLSLK